MAFGPVDLRLRRGRGKSVPDNAFGRLGINAGHVPRRTLRVRHILTHRAVSERAVELFLVG
ncbi:MAG: hypothetical protein ACREL4_09745 [Gemmatimonadales bacterium]